MNTTARGTEIGGGVDTHRDLHTAAVVNLDGTVLGTESFSTTRAGYRAMLRWFRRHREFLRVGVESTSRGVVPRARTTRWTRSRWPRSDSAPSKPCGCCTRLARRR